MRCRSAALVIFMGVVLSNLGIRETQAHCQVPCGIYDHHARIHSMYEDAATIEKAVTQIQELSSKTDALSRNQLVRWVNTKEQHADAIQRTIADYFLTQVVKPAEPGDAKAFETYLKSLADHHAVLVAAMKVKQSVDPTAVDALKQALEKLETHYPNP